MMQAWFVCSLNSIEDQLLMLLLAQRQLRLSTVHLLAIYVQWLKAQGTW